MDADDNGGELIALDGAGSEDWDGTIISWIWDEDLAPIGTGTMPTVSFAVGAYTVTLTVTDDDDLTGTDTVVITVNPYQPNSPPTADAGFDQTVADMDQDGSETVPLDGSASHDVDGTIVS